MRIKLIILSAAILCSICMGAQTESVITDAENAVIDAAQTLSSGGDIDAAIKKLESFRESGCDAVFYYLGECYQAKGKRGEAGVAYTTAAEMDPDNTTYQEALANWYYANGDAEKGSGIYLALLEKYPNRYRNANTLTLLGDQQLHQFKFDEAMQSYDTALMYDPEYVLAILGKAEIYRMKKNYPGFFTSMSIFTANRDVAPEPKCAYVGQILDRVDGRFFHSWNVQLDSMVTSCVQAHPSDSSTLKMAGRWFYGTGRKDKGKAYFDTFLETYPKCLEAHYIHLQICSQEDDHQAVLEECDKILTLVKGNPSEEVSALSIKGDTYYKLDDRKSAYRCYDKALKIIPDYVPVLNNYAYFLCLEGKSLKKAEKMSRITVEKEPDNPTYLDTLGWILHLRGKDAEAKPFFKHAMLYGGKDSSEVLRHYATVLSALGENDLAIYYQGLADRAK